MNMTAPRNRMSPLTALFFGFFFMGAVAIASGAAVLLYTMRIIDSNASAVWKFAGNTVEGLPELLKSLPPALADVLQDRRAPEYAGNIDVEVKLISDDESSVMRPVLTIKNRGEEVVSLLALRVAVLDSDGVPRGDWTEVVATPLTLDDDWRGPLMPGVTRHVVLHGRRTLTTKPEMLVAVAEVGDIRVWEQKN